MTRLDSTIESALLLWMRKAIGKINCQQGIYFDVAPTAGTWTVTLDAVTSGAIQWNATNTDVKDALEAMSNIDSVAVTGDFTDGFEVEFDGTDQYTDFSKMTADISGLTTTTNAKVWKHQEGRDGLLVLWAKQEGLRPSGTYASINILNLQQEGAPNKSYVATDTWQIEYKYLYQFSVKIYADENYMNWMQLLKNSLDKEDIKTFQRTNDLWLRNYSETIDLTQLLADEYQFICQADFFFGYGKDVQDSIIEVNRITGTITTDQGNDINIDAR